MNQFGLRQVVHTILEAAQAHADQSITGLRRQQHAIAPRRKSRVGNPAPGLASDKRGSYICDHGDNLPCTSGIPDR